MFSLSVSVDRLERELCMLFCKPFVVNKVLECIHASLANAERCGARGSRKHQANPICVLLTGERERDLLMEL